MHSVDVRIRFPELCSPICNPIPPTPNCGLPPRTPQSSYWYQYRYQRVSAYSSCRELGGIDGKPWCTRSDLVYSTERATSEWSRTCRASMSNMERGGKSVGVHLSVGIYAKLTCNHGKHHQCITEHVQPPRASGRPVDYHRPLCMVPLSVILVPLLKRTK